MTFEKYFGAPTEGADGAGSDDRSAGTAIGKRLSDGAIVDGWLQEDKRLRRAAYVEAFDSAIEETMASAARMVVGLVAHRQGDPTPPSAENLCRSWIEWKAERRKVPVRRCGRPRHNPLRTLVWEMLDGISGPECRVLHHGSAPLWTAYLMDIVAERDIALPGGRPSRGSVLRLVREYRKARRPAPRPRSRRTVVRWPGPWPVPPAFPEVLVEELSA